MATIPFHANIQPTQSYGLFSLNGTAGSDATNEIPGYMRVYGPDGYRKQRRVTDVKLSKFVDGQEDPVEVALPLDKTSLATDDQIIVDLTLDNGDVISLSGRYHQETRTISGQRSTSGGLLDERVFSLTVDGQHIAPPPPV